MKDAVATMGDILPDDAGGRDAVHVAVISAIAGEELNPGQHIGLENTFKSENVASTESKHLGIVDPFIKATVKPGQRFWLYIYPRMITGLNHQWSHPDLPLDNADPTALYHTPAQKLESEKWLRDFCDDRDAVDYETLIKIAEAGEKGYINREYGGYIGVDCFVVYGNDAHGEIPDRFWNHLEVVTGRRFKERPEYFSCSC